MEGWHLVHLSMAVGETGCCCGGYGTYIYTYIEKRPNSSRYYSVYIGLSTASVSDSHPLKVSITASTTTYNL